MGFDNENGYSMDDPDLAFFAGYGTTPTNSILWEESKLVVIAAIINIHTNTIIDASINLVTEISKQFITRALIGKNIIEDADRIIAGLSRYHAPAQKSIIVAYKALLNRYMTFCIQNERK